MWDYVSIVRSDQRLERAAKRIHNIFTEVEDFYKRTKIFSDILELRNLIASAHIIVKSARMRKESRGLHYTIDFPDTDEKSGYSIIKNTNP
jgi:L-aspartate oxidase